MSTLLRWTYLTHQTSQLLNRRSLYLCVNKYTVGRNRRSLFNKTSRPVIWAWSQSCELHLRNVHESYKSPASRHGDVEEETSDSESDSDDELVFSVHPDDSEMADNYKDLTLHCSSRRADAILSKSLNFSRKVIDDAFLGSKLRYNNMKLLKKSKLVKTGDSIELIISHHEGIETFKRVRINKVESQRTATDKYVIHLRAWRANNKRETIDKWRS